MGAVMAVLMLHTHLYAAFVFACVNPVVVIALFLRRRSLADCRSWVVGQAAAFALFLPAFLNLVYRAEEVVETGFWTPDPSGHLLLQMADELFPEPMRAFLGAVALAAVILWGLRRLGTALPNGQAVRWGVSPAAAVAILVAALLGPLALAWLASVLFEPVMYARYFLFAVPVVSVLAATALARLPIRPLAQWAAVAAVTILLVRPALNEGTLSIVGHSNWRDLVATQQRLREEGDETILFPFETRHAYRYYAGGAAPVATPETAGDLLTPPDASRVWIIIRWNPAMMDRTIEAYRHAGFDLKREFPFRPLQMVLMERG